MADTEIRIDDRIAATIASKLRSIKGEATAADTAIDRLKANLNIGNSASLLKAASDADRLNRSLKAASQTTYSMVGRTSSLAERARRLAAEEARAAREIERTTAALRRQDAATRASNGSMGQLVGLLGTVVGVRTFIDAANDAQTLENKIRSATTSTEQFEAVQTRLYQMAINNRVAVVDLGTAYQRFRNAMDGVSDSTVLGFIDTLSKGLITFGATTGEAASTITQLSQAFNKGKLDGDEFRSVMENFPPLMKALTQALGVTKAEIYELSRSGALSFEVLIKAMQKMAPTIDEMFGKTSATIAQALERLQTQFTWFMYKNSDAAKLLISAIRLIGDNLHIVVPAVVAFGAAWATVQLARIIADMYRLIEAVTVFIARNALAIIQIGLWVAAIALAITAVAALARIVAYATGNGEAFDNWLTSSIADMINFGKSVTDTLSGVATDATQEFTQSLDKASKSLNPGVTSAAGEAKTSIAEIGTASKTAADAAVTNIKRVEQAVDQLTRTMRYSEQQAKRLYSELAQGNYNPGGYSTKFSDGSTKINTGSKSSIQTLSMASSTNTGNKSSIIQGLRPLPNEASTQDGYWDASNRGNGMGQSFVIRNGVRTDVPGFARGGQFAVGGRAGRDTNPVSFWASKGERVTVETKKQQREADAAGRGGGTVINVDFQVFATDADSFRRSRNQVAADFARIIKQ